MLRCEVPKVAWTTRVSTPSREGFPPASPAVACWRTWLRFQHWVGCWPSSIRMTRREQAGASDGRRRTNTGRDGGGSTTSVARPKRSLRPARGNVARSSTTARERWSAAPAGVTPPARPARCATRRPGSVSRTRVKRETPAAILARSARRMAPVPVLPPPVPPAQRAGVTGSAQPAPTAVTALASARLVTRTRPAAAAGPAPSAPGRSSARGRPASASRTAAGRRVARAMAAGGSVRPAVAPPTRRVSPTAPACRR